MHVNITLKVLSMKCETIIFVRYSKQPFIVQQMHPIVGSKKMLNNL